MIEALHPAGDMAVGLAAHRPHDPARGHDLDRRDAGRVRPARAQGLRPERYAELDIPEPGLGFDIVAQVAAWLRGPESPLPGLAHLFMTGASYTGTFQRVFIGDGFHARARRPDGGPAIDGYLIQISSGAFMLGGYTPLSEGTPVPPAGDRRRTIPPLDVPVIEMLSEGEAETNAGSRRPDSDAPDDRYRLYEVAGARHMTAHDAGPLALPVVETPSDFPMDMLVGGALLNLRRWVTSRRHAAARGAPADPARPRARPRAVAATRRCPLRRDEHGNAVGGAALALGRRADRQLLPAQLAAFAGRPAARSRGRAAPPRARGRRRPDGLHDALHAREAARALRHARALRPAARRRAPAPGRRALDLGRRRGARAAAGRREVLS